MTTLRTPLSIALGLLLTASFAACSSPPPGEEEDDTAVPKRTDGGAKATASATASPSATSTTPVSDVPIGDSSDAGASDGSTSLPDGSLGTIDGAAGTAGTPGVPGTFTGRCTPQAGSGIEAEANDSVATANPYDVTKEFFGRITPGTDKDFLKFTFPANATRWNYSVPCFDLPNTSEFEVFVNGDGARVAIDNWTPRPGNEYTLELSTKAGKQTSYRFKFSF